MQFLLLSFIHLHRCTVSSSVQRDLHGMPGQVEPEATRRTNHLATPLPFFAATLPSYAVPVISCAAPVISCAAPLLSCAARLLSYAAPVISYAAPLLNYASCSLTRTGTEDPEYICAAKALFSCPAIISQRLEPRIISNEPLENTEEESEII